MEKEGKEEEEEEEENGEHDRQGEGFVAEKIAQIPKPEASLTDMSFKGMSRDAVTLHSEVSVTNPYSHRLPVCELSYTLKSAGRVIASGTMADPGWIAAAGEVTKLEVPVKLPYDFLISLMRDVGRDWDIDYQLDVGLTIDLPVVGNFTIPLSTQGELKLPPSKTCSDHSLPLTSLAHHARTGLCSLCFLSSVLFSLSFSLFLITESILSLCCCFYRRLIKHFV
uniref:Water stress and hypersensitive response domain-containing protein n=1 Tax=Ananas comosus var. bracteatus TaxID=296719 RepID=A0A6V7NZW3_ANACO|nr:unnamed protein product [Ananas comosus var. bracteatus]